VVVGDPTEGALIVAARKAGLTQQALEQEMPRLDTIPFDQTFSTWRARKPDQLIYVKGSTEPSSNGALRGSIQRDAGTFGPHSGAVSRCNGRAGLRVLASKKPAANQHSLDHPDLDQGLVFLGLQG